MLSLRDTRKGLRLTQAELAEQLGLHQTSVSRMETGAMEPDERTLLAVEALVMRSQQRGGVAGRANRRGGNGRALDGAAHHGKASA